MLIIRKEQMEVFRRYVLQQFEDRMVTHLRTACHERLNDMPEAELRTMIQYGIAKADGYGVKAEDDVQRYLELMVVYGSDFDTNPQTSWAGDILRTANLAGSVKIDRMDKYDLFLMEGQT
jgi:hypothetical protein